MIEQVLSRDLLYLACQQHILELIAATPFEKELPSSPNIQLFKRFKDNWKFIDQAKMLPQMRKQQVVLRISGKKMAKFIEGVFSTAGVSKLQPHFVRPASRLPVANANLISF